MIVRAMPYVGRQLDFTLAATAASSSVKPTFADVGIFVVVFLRNFQRCFLNLPRRRSPYFLRVTSRLLGTSKISVAFNLPVAEAMAGASVMLRKIYGTEKIKLFLTIQYELSYFM